MLARCAMSTGKPTSGTLRRLSLQLLVYSAFSWLKRALQIDAFDFFLKTVLGKDKDAKCHTDHPYLETPGSRMTMILTLGPALCCISQLSAIP